MPSWSTVSSNLLGLVGPQLETARDQITLTLQGLLPPSQAPTAMEDSAVETSGGTPSELESQGTVRGGNPNQAVFKCRDIRSRGRYNREGMWVPPTLKSTPETSVPTVTAFRPPRVGDELFSEGENGEDENGKDGNQAGERGEGVAVAFGDSEDSDGDVEYLTPTNSPSRGGDKGKKLTSVKTADQIASQKAKKRRKALRLRHGVPGKSSPWPQRSPPLVIFPQSWPVHKYCNKKLVHSIKNPALCAPKKIN